MRDIEKFDYVISNPPYQDAGNSAIFHNFQTLGETLSENTTMIYPADKWMMKSGKGIGIDEFSTEQLNDRKLKQLIVYENANIVFQGIDLHGGISIVIKQNKYDNQGFINITTYDFENEEKQLNIPVPSERTLSISNNMNEIVQKVLRTVNRKNTDNHKKYIHNENTDTKSNKNATARFLNELNYSTSLYGIDSSFIQRNRSTVLSEDEYEKKLKEQNSAKNHNDSSINNDREKIVEEYVKVLANETPGTQGRVGWFYVPIEIIPKNSQINDRYIIAISTRYAAGYPKRSQQARIFAPDEFFGDSRYGVAGFDTLEEAENFFKWMSSKTIRTLILSSSRRVKNFGTNVPLLNSYRTLNEEIDFSQDIDEQLIEKYGLDENDVKFIEKTVQTLGNFAMDETVE